MSLPKSTDRTLSRSANEFDSIQTLGLECIGIETVWKRCKNIPLHVTFIFYILFGPGGDSRKRRRQSHIIIDFFGNECLLLDTWTGHDCPCYKVGHQT